MILGVDPGVHGALAFLEDNGALHSVLDVPTVLIRVGKANKHRLASQALALLVAAHKPAHAYVEAVAAMPGQGVSSCFAFGQAAGIIEGILAALGVPVTYTTPAVWKRAMQVTAEKGSSRRRAMQLWPAHAGDFARVKDDGRAEAAMIALHGLRATMRDAA